MPRVRCDKSPSRNIKDKINVGKNVLNKSVDKLFNAQKKKQQKETELSKYRMVEEQKN